MEKRKKLHDLSAQGDGLTDNPEDEQLFLKAMADVKPISHKNIVENRRPAANRQHPISPVPHEDQHVLLKLKTLVSKGDGFVISHTPEYMEGTNYNVHPEISRRLHKGIFSIQAHIDLHGMTVAEAEEQFDIFMKNSISSGKRGLLIVHGRGLSSPNKPVLKSCVVTWLTHGPWRKWVIAFSSARACDGGAGATYVLLRKSPVTKRFRKRKPSGVK